MQFHVNEDSELVLTPTEGPTLIVLSYDPNSGYYSVEFMDVMFDVRFEDTLLTNVKVPDDPENDQAAALIAEDYADLIYAGCMKFKELVVEG